jgi:hypothetical protein
VGNLNFKIFATFKNNKNIHVFFSLLNNLWELWLSSEATISTDSDSIP